MENFEDNFYNDNDLTELADRFERMVSEGTTSYYEVDDLEFLLDHFIAHHRLELAFKVVETAHEQHPQNKQLSIREAELLSLADKHSEALDLLNDVEVLESFNPDFHMTKASILSQIGRYDKAIRSLHEALKYTEQDPDIIYLNLAIEHQNLEQFDQAVLFLQKALEANPQNEDALYELSYCCELTQDYDKSITIFSKVIDKSPYNPHAWFNLGTAYQALEMFDKALTAFDYVIVIDENFHAAHFNKANVLVRLERYAEAVELYKKALSFEILDSLIYFYIGDCYENLEDYKSALTFFEKAIKKDETMAEAWVGASSALDQMGRELEALVYARKAITLDPDNGDYHCFLAGLQMKYDLLIESQESFEKAIDFGYIHEDLWEDYAQLALSMKNMELANHVVVRGLALFPENTLLELYMCIVLYGTGFDEQAFESLVELLIREPELIHEFVLYYPKGIESKDVQLLINSLNQRS